MMEGIRKWVTQGGVAGRVARRPGSKQGKAKERENVVHATARRAALKENPRTPPAARGGAREGRGKKTPQKVYASSSAAAAAATADGFGHARASKFECGSGTLA